MRTNLPVTNNEVQLTDATLIVSKTDLKGRMTYINKDFLDISGFTEAELIGEPHNLVRHPDMPVEAFQDLWDTLKAGRPWTGYVKNRCKNGDYYWVLANAAPIVENGQVTGYISVRRMATREAIEAHEAAYRLFREKRQGRLIIRFGKAVKPGGIRIQDWNIGTKLWAGMLATLAAGGVTPWRCIAGAAPGGLARRHVDACAGSIHGRRHRARHPPTDCRNYRHVFQHRPR